MWTRGILNRFADTLPVEDGKKLREEIQAIIWFGNDGPSAHLCVANEGEKAFERAGLAALYRTLVSNTLKFTSMEDLTMLKRWDGKQGNAGSEN